MSVLGIAAIRVINGFIANGSRPGVSGSDFVQLTIIFPYPVLN